MTIKPLIIAGAAAAALLMSGCGSHSGGATGDDGTGAATTALGTDGDVGVGTSAGGSGDGSVGDTGSGDDTGSVGDTGSGDDTAAGSAGEALPQPDVDDVPDPVATVNGDDIGHDEFVAVYRQQFRQAVMMQMQSGQDVDQDQLKQQVADLLVNNVLLKQAAEHAGITASDDDIDEMLGDLADENGLDSTDDLLSALQQQGTSEQEARGQAAAQYEVQTYIDRQGDITEPSDEELHELYDEQVEQATGNGGADPDDIPDFDDVRDRLAEHVTQEQESKVAHTLVDGLRDDADVTVYL